MSTDRLILENSGKNDKQLIITSYWGGTRGRMLQIGQYDNSANHAYITLTEKDAEAIVIDLINWLNHD